MIGITEKAREMLAQFQNSADDEIERVLRVEIIGRGDKGFRYDLNLVDLAEKMTVTCPVKSMIWWYSSLSVVLHTWKGQP